MRGSAPTLPRAGVSDLQDQNSSGGVTLSEVVTAP